jgi:hypothetical protein
VYFWWAKRPEIVQRLIEQHTKFCVDS